MYWFPKFNYIGVFAIFQLFYLLTNAVLVYPTYDKTNPTPWDVGSGLEFPLYGRSKQGISPIITRHLRRMKRDGDGSAPNPAPIIQSLGPTTGYGEFYITVPIGGQNITLIIDTGSPDTWIVPKNITCIGWHPIVSPTLGQINLPHRYCGLSNVTLFDPDESETLTVINPDAKYGFQVMFADQSWVNGWVADDIFAIGDLWINQTVGIANQTSVDFQEDGAGILGLGFPGTIPVNSSHTYLEWGFYDPIPYDCHEVYPSFVESLGYQAQRSMFSIALEEIGTAESNWKGAPETVNSGKIAFGGVVDIPVGVPLAITRMNPKYSGEGISNCTSNPGNIGYSVVIDSITFPKNDTQQKAPLLGQFTAIVDTGSSINLFVPPMAEAIAQAYDPPAFLSMSGLEYVVDCDAKVPDLGIEFNGVVITIGWKDMIRPYIWDVDFEVAKICSTGFGMTFLDAGAVLGHPFLRNVVATYDIANKEMRFGQRYDRLS